MPPARWKRRSQLLLCDFAQRRRNADTGSFIRLARHQHCDHGPVPLSAADSARSPQPASRAAPAAAPVSCKNVLRAILVSLIMLRCAPPVGSCDRTSYTKWTKCPKFVYPTLAAIRLMADWWCRAGSGLLHFLLNDIILQVQAGLFLKKAGPCNPDSGGQPRPVLPGAAHFPDARQCKP